MQGEGIPPFKGDAVVAFMDLQAFKYLMSRDLAPDALDVFYKFGQLWLQAEKEFHVPGLFVFDSGDCMGGSLCG